MRLWPTGSGSENLSHLYQIYYIECQHRATLSRCDCVLWNSLWCSWQSPSLGVRRQLSLWLSVSGFTCIELLLFSQTLRCNIAEKHSQKRQTKTESSEVCCRHGVCSLSCTECLRGYSGDPWASKEQCENRWIRDAGALPSNTWLIFFKGLFSKIRYCVRSKENYRSCWQKKVNFKSDN